MSSSALSALEKDFYKESYIRRLYKHGYPATKEQMTKFNKKFYDDHNLKGEKRATVSKVLRNFSTNLGRNKNPGVQIISRKPELKEMVSAVVADCRQKRDVDDDQEDDSDLDWHQEDDVDLEQEQLAEDDDWSDLEEEMAENEGAMAILENRNEELAKTLKMKDEECQQLEEKVRLLEEALQKKSEKQVQLLKKSDGAKLETQKRSLEEEIRSLKEALQKKTDTTKLEEEIRLLKEALHKKDQMLEAALQVQQTLSTLVNKTTPQ